MEAEMPRYVQMWLPGFAPAEQPDLPGFGEHDDTEPSISDMETERMAWDGRR